jgi:uncharacterized protein YggE
MPAAAFPDPARPTRFAACAAAAVAVAVLAGCDSRPAPPVETNARQVTVVGSGTVQGAPDTLTADVGIEVVAPDVTAAMAQTNERQQAVIDALKAGGIDATDISTTTVSVAPQYGENSAITGYRASNAITVTIRQLDKAPGALASVVDAGGNTARINGVRYSIEDDSRLVSDARARAFEDARNRAAQYAELAGLSLGTVISISEAAESNQPRRAPIPQGAMAADVPLEPGQQTVSFAVTAVWELN